MISGPIEDDASEFGTFSHRLNDTINSFENTAEFPQADRATLLRVAKRRRLMRENVDAAVQEGKLWPIIKAEFARDFGSLFDDFVRFEAELDARIMQHAHK